MGIPEIIGAAVGYRNKIALRDERKTVTFQELEEAVVRFDGMLGEHAEGSGFVLGCMLPNRIEYPLAYLAAFFFGYPIVPIDRRLPREVVEHMIRDAGVRMLLVDDATAPGAGGLERICRVVDIDDHFHPSSRRRRSAGAGTHALGSINYTSGTTGRPKGVMLSHRNYLASCEGFLRNIPELEDTRHILHVLPFSHSTAALLLPAVKQGIPSTVCECAGPRDVLDAAARFQPDAAVLHPALICGLLDAVSEYPGRVSNLRSLRTVYYGSSPMSPRKLTHAREVFGPVFVQVYGMTETLPPVAVLGKEDHEAGLEGKRNLLTSCGRPALGIELRISGDGGGETERNEPGEILVRGDNVMEGYLGMESETGSFLRGGWAHTGDMAYMENGYLFLVGRKNDVIRRGGFSVYPREIENVVSCMAGVEECAAFGIPDEREGEVPCCAVVFGKTWKGEPEDLRRRLESRLPPSKVPSRFVAMDALPRNLGGKIDRKALSRTVAEGA